MPADARLLADLAASTFRETFAVGLNQHATGIACID
jgi:hypothetical protein